MFQNTQQSTNQPDQSVQDDDGPENPPEPNLEIYEEQNVKFSVKSKLYEKVKDPEGNVSVHLLGIGMLYVKNLSDPNKYQVVFRQDPDLRKVLINEVFTRDLPVKSLQKALQIAFLTSSGESKFYIVKLASEKDTNHLYELLTFSRT